MYNVLWYSLVHGMVCCAIFSRPCGNPYKTPDINVPLTGKYKIKSKMYKQRKSSPDIELYKP